MGLNHRPHDRYGNKVDEDDIAATISFTTCLRAMNTLSLKVINELTNQLFFQSELKFYFLAGMDEIYLKDQVKFTKYKAQITALTPHGNDRSRGTVDADDEHSPVDVILATMTEFLNFLSHQTHSEDLERVYYLLLKKLLLRYFVFLRDYHCYCAQFNKKGKKGTVTTGSTMNAGGSVVVNTRVENSGGQNQDGSDDEQDYHHQQQQGRKDAIGSGDPVINRLKADVRQMTMFYSSTKTTLFTKPTKSKSKKSDGNKHHLHHNEGEEGEENEESRYDIMLGILFKKLQSIFVLTVTNEWNGPQLVDEFLLQRFSITVSDQSDRIIDCTYVWLFV
jgi:hypothetical protein